MLSYTPHILRKETELSSKINGVLVVLCLILIGYWFFSILFHSSSPNPTSSDVPCIRTQSLELPHSFQQSLEDYQAVNAVYFPSSISSVSLAVPDLKHILSYGGINKRPDAKDHIPQIFIGIKQANLWTSVQSGEPLYLTLDSTHLPSRLIFSPHNAKTSFWLIVYPSAEGIDVTATLELDSTTDKFDKVFHFTISEKEAHRVLFSPHWEIGSLRVDSSFLIRQKAKWYGKDLFLEKLGSKELPDLPSKERIEWGEGANKEIFFLAIGDCLTFEEGHWKNSPIGTNTLGKPILILKKQDPHMLEFDLWDSEGRSKLVLQLHKSPILKVPLDGLHMRFLGARSKKEINIEINRKRLLVSPDDWVVIHDKECKKIQSIQDMESYIEGRLAGKLIVFEGIEKIEEKLTLKTLVFDETRSCVEEVKLKLNPAQENTMPTKTNVKASPNTIQAQHIISKEGTKERDSKSPLHAETESD